VVKIAALLQIGAFIGAISDSYSEPSVIQRPQSVHRIQRAEMIETTAMCLAGGFAPIGTSCAVYVDVRLMNRDWDRPCRARIMQKRPHSHGELRGPSLEPEILPNGLVTRRNNVRVFEVSGDRRDRAVCDLFHSVGQENRAGKKGMLVMAETNSVVAIYETHSQAEEAVKELQKSGFDMKKMSIVGKDYHTDEHVVGYYNTGDRMKYWGKLGAFWGGLWGMLFGAAFFVIPGIGPILVAGPLVAWIVGALEGAVVVGGLSALGAGLYSIGIPKNSVLKYELALKSDKFLLLAHGTADEVAKARDIIQTTHPVEVAVHAAEQPQHAGGGGR
jgi:uncharacterized membrane protein